MDFDGFEHYGFVWISMDVDGSGGILTDLDGFERIRLDLDGSDRILTNVEGCQ